MAGSTRVYCIIPLGFPALPRCTLFTLVSSKITARAAATGASAPKAAKTSAASTVIVSASSAPVASPTAAHQVSEQKEYETGVSGLDQEEEDEDNRTAADDQLRETKVYGCLLTVVLMRLLR